MSLKGINAKESHGEINLGINVDQFVSQLKELPSETGWVNIILVPLSTPHPKGYTHFIRKQKPKNDERKG